MVSGHTPGKDEYIFNVYMSILCCFSLRIWGNNVHDNGEVPFSVIWTDEDRCPVIHSPPWGIIS